MKTNITLFITLFGISSIVSVFYASGRLIQTIFASEVHSPYVTTQEAIKYTPSEEEGEEIYIFGETNAYRKDKDLEPLKHDSDLHGRACARAEYIASTGSFSHEGWEDYIPLIHLGAGENLAKMPQKQDPVAYWIESPSHEANLSGNYTHMAVCTRDIYTVQFFIRKIN